jgi:hypothetical protein
MTGPGSPDNKLLVSRQGNRLKSAGARAPAPTVSGVSPLKVRSSPLRSESAADAKSSQTPAHAAQSSGPPVAVNLFRPIEPAGKRTGAEAALNVATRATRLTLDAMLILVFSPVIAGWWMLERRHKKNRT